MSPPWQPLLSGAAAERALAAARDIAAATGGGGAYHPPGLEPEGTRVVNNALAGGRAGQCLLHAYLALHGGSAEGAATALDLLDQATDAAASERMSASLFLGFPGIAWASAHLAGRLFAEAHDGQHEVDAALEEALQAPWQGGYDLFNGLVGLGVYALERVPRPSAVRCLAAVVAQLRDRAEHTPEGATFFSPLAALPPSYHQEFPTGAYVLGMGQGLAGVIALLGAACRAGVATGEARPLLAATVGWLLARERESASLDRFPEVYLPGARPSPTGLAWRFGELGIAAGLMMAARGAGEPAWESAARRIARAAAERRPEAAADRPGAGLADGPAGIGHVFNRLFQATGDAALGAAAQRWLDHALALREPGRGIAGFRTAYRGAWLDEPGFLRGASGIGLALLAAASPVDPAWDHVLLIS